MAVALAFANSVDAYDMTGQDLWNAFESCLDKIFYSPFELRRLLHVTGMRYTVKLKNKKGKRILKMETLEIEKGEEVFKPIDLKRTYRVVTPEYLTTQFTLIANGHRDVL